MALTTNTFPCGRRASGPRWRFRRFFRTLPQISLRASPRAQDDSETALTLVLVDANEAMRVLRFVGQVTRR